MSVIKRIRPFHAITKIARILEVIVGVDDGHKQRRQGSPLPRFHIEGSAGTLG